MYKIFLLFTLVFLACFGGEELRLDREIRYLEDRVDILEEEISKLKNSKTKKRTKKDAENIEGEEIKND